MSKDDVFQKVVTGDLGKAIKPSAMTPLTEGIKPAAMTPTATRMQTNDALKPVAMAPLSTGGEERGLKPQQMAPPGTGAGHKPVPMTPAPSQGPAQPPSSPSQPKE